MCSSLRPQQFGPPRKPYATLIEMQTFSTSVFDAMRDKLLVRFLSFIEFRETGGLDGRPCWEWRDGSGLQGRGRFWAAGQNWMAYRIAYEIWIGPIPYGLHLDHLCRNPPCVNPDHLEPVTHAENMRRGERANKTHCKRDHLLSGPNLYIDSKKRRVCRTCKRLWYRKRHGSKIILRDGEFLSTGGPEQCPQGHPLEGNNLYVSQGRQHCRKCRQKSDGWQGGLPTGERTHCPQEHPYSGDNLYIDPSGRRHCRTCNRKRSREWGRKQRASKRSA